MSMAMAPLATSLAKSCGSAFLALARIDPTIVALHRRDWQRPD
jgi:hypothetical protein